MAAKKYNEDDLYEFAAQIILQEKEWDDFNFLDDDDKEKLLAIVKRGKDALVQQRTKIESSAEESPVRYVRGILYTEMKKKHKRKPSKSRFGIAKLAQRIGFTEFPIIKIVEESEIVRRKVLEELNRKLNPKELSLLFENLKEEQANLLFRTLSPPIAREVKFFLGKEQKEWSDYEINRALAKYSIVASIFLSSLLEASPAIKSYVKEYLNDFHKQLKDYCSDLLKKLGVLENLKTFNKQQWMRLTGLTPRQDMATLSMALSDSVMKQLMQFLPVHQKEDVNEMIHFLQTDKVKKLTFYVTLLEAINRWSAVVQKVADSIDL